MAQRICFRRRRFVARCATRGARVTGVTNASFTPQETVPNTLARVDGSSQKQDFQKKFF
ncbi:MAG: hypothetical protein HOP29_02295 [Phycisphaerales bacterium]|nr:hypothetical protein [Phycisphaerales bacterium]